jgi:hypothetical protein
MGLSLDIEYNKNFGHISLVEGKANIVSISGETRDCIVNMPLVAGDKIITGDGERVELQFDNGTILRLGKNSQLKIETILANSLSSNARVTTLFLNHGRLYSIVNSYKNNIFEVLTQNTSIAMGNATTNAVSYSNSKGTRIFVDLGRVKIKYGKELSRIKTHRIKRKEYAIITLNHKLKEQKFDLNIDFMAWNTYVNSNFKALHEGRNKIPPKAFLGNKAIVYFAEKWSSKYGEWSYDDFLGYVWKPYQEKWVYNRPFFHAKWVNINGQIFVIPAQKWGWIPSQLGAWVWLGKKGWVWMPGSNVDLCSTEYYSGVDFLTSASSFTDPYRRYYRNTLEGQLSGIFGDMGLYYTYIEQGRTAWGRAFSKRYGKKSSLPRFKILPVHIQKIINKSRKLGLNRIKNYFVQKQSPTELKRAYQHVVQIGQHKAMRMKSMVKKITLKSVTAKNAIKMKSTKKPNLRFNITERYFRSFSPDVKLAQRMRLKLTYDYKKNAIYAPRLNLHSNRINSLQRSKLRIRSRSVTPTSRNSSYSRTSGGNSMNSVVGRSSGTSVSSTVSKKKD